jgi:hypothetical protein
MDKVGAAVQRTKEKGERLKVQEERPRQLEGLNNKQKDKGAGIRLKHNGIRQIEDCKIFGKLGGLKTKRMTNKAR